MNRCVVTPLPDQQVSFSIDGRERTRWHFARHYPRPFFFPLTGPSGAVLTRMGHPGAPNHDHHRSIWFAHHKVLGIDFWGDGGTARIEQQEWLCYEDGDQECRMAVKLGWYDGHEPRALLVQELVAALRPASDGDCLLELQATFTPISESLEFGQTNFGFLAVRVAKEISAHFGGGQLTGSTGAQAEPNLFGQPAQWMDYSGPVSVRDGDKLKSVVEGITYFDHPANPGQPTRWHVREDGWMGASVGMQSPIVTTRASPLRLRYLLHSHAGQVAQAQAEVLRQGFAATPAYRVQRSQQKHTFYEIQRESAAG